MEYLLGWRYSCINPRMAQKVKYDGLVGFGIEFSECGTCETNIIVLEYLFVDFVANSV